MACLNDDVETVSTLLEHGADVEEKNDVRNQMMIMMMMILMMITIDVNCGNYNDSKVDPYMYHSKTKSLSPLTYIFQLNLMYIKALLFMMLIIKDH